MANTHNFSLWQQRLVRALCWSLVLGALAVVFGWYLEPDFMLTMADQVWSCF
ncbi:MAG: hypothetical protein PHE74_04150 [Comamonas sp.]|nr:hypothetical protein [Comamonas sp.]